MNHPEFNFHSSVCEYLRYHPAKPIFLSDTVASVKLTKPQAMRNAKIQNSAFKVPDLIILEPRGIYSGLFLELKIKSPYKKNSNELLSNPHIEAQAESLQKLRKKGYYADFCWEFNQAKKIIDNYLSL